jgi:hypothetical protein
MNRGSTPYVCVCVCLYIYIYIYVHVTHLHLRDNAKNENNYISALLVCLHDVDRTTLPVVYFSERWW